MKPKKVIESSKITYNGTPHWVKFDALHDDSIRNIAVFKDEDLKQPLTTKGNVQVIIQKDKLNEFGAGFAVSGGGGGYGNPSSQYAGRGFGFGSSSQNLGGGPNLMYTYEIKPLNHFLEPEQSSQGVEPPLRMGSNIKGKVLGKDEDTTGQIIDIKKDDDNNIKHYEIIDSDTNTKKMLDPTSVEFYDPYEDPMIDDELAQIYGEEMGRDVITNESFYPRLNESFEYFLLDRFDEDISFNDLDEHLSDSDITEFQLMIWAFLEEDIYSKFMDTRKKNKGGFRRGLAPKKAMGLGNYLEKEMEKIWDYFDDRNKKKMQPLVEELINYYQEKIDPSGAIDIDEDDVWIALSAIAENWNYHNSAAVVGGSYAGKHWHEALKQHHHFHGVLTEVRNQVRDNPDWLKDKINELQYIIISNKEDVS